MLDLRREPADRHVFDHAPEGRVRVEVDGKADVLAFYGAAPEGAPADPVIFLRGDAVEKRDTSIVANEWYILRRAGAGRAAERWLLAPISTRAVLVSWVPQVTISTGDVRAK
jgi:hypothetical protein